MPEWRRRESLSSGNCWHDSERERGQGCERDVRGGRGSSPQSGGEGRGD